MDLKGRILVFSHGKILFFIQKIAKNKSHCVWPYFCCGFVGCPKSGLFVYANSNLGSITVCKLIADTNGNITNGGSFATSSFSISGIEILSHGTVAPSDGVIGNSVFNNPLSLNADIINSDEGNDAECVTYENLVIGSYFYGEEQIAGDGWLTPLYNDQNNKAINSLDDFFVYSGELFTEPTSDDESRNTNADGHIILTESRPARTLVVLNRREAVSEDENFPPIITLLGDNPLNILLGDAFTDPGATAFDEEDGDITANIIVGGDTVDTSATSTFVITYNVEDSEGLTAEEVIRTVTVFVEASSTPPSTPPSSGCVSNCVVGGGGSIPLSLEIFNEKVERKDSTTAIVSWDTNAHATSRVLYDETSRADAQVLFAEYAFGTLKDTQFIINHSVEITGLKEDTVYYFRPASNNVTEEVFGIELTLELALESAPPSAGGGPFVSGEAPGEVLGEAECSEYLLDYIKLGESNNPLEVKKLQIFLRDFEGFSNIEVTGTYSRGDFDAVSIFQNRYKEDVLDTWLLPGPTGYVYYTTRKKINEIYCNFTKEFPLAQFQLNEIDGFRGLMLSLRDAGAAVPPDGQKTGAIPGEESDGDKEFSELAIVVTGGDSDKGSNFDDFIFGEAGVVGRVDSASTEEKGIFGKISAAVSVFSDKINFSLPAFIFILTLIFVISVLFRRRESS